MRIVPASIVHPALAAALGPDGQTVTIPLAEALHLACDPGGAALVVPIDVPEWFRALGPYLASLQVYTATENRTTNHGWKVIFSNSTTERTWNAAIDLFANVTANGETAQTPYTTSSNFGRRMRFAFSVQPTAGTAAEGAVVWSYLAGRLRT
jgi:hypothetical protein